MNKRQLKKEIKKVADMIKTARKNGVNVTVKSHMYVDSNGKECDPTEKGARFRNIRPQITVSKI